jgi:hypothetical protein
MRALTGAILAAGAMIGLGLTALGLGTRYQDILLRGSDGKLAYIRFSEMDTAMMLILVSLLTALVIGLITTFVGLAYHHERRLREYHMHTAGHKSVEI